MTVMLHKCMLRHALLEVNFVTMCARRSDAKALAAAWVSCRSSAGCQMMDLPVQC